MHELQGRLFFSPNLTIVVVHHTYQYLLLLLSVPILGQCSLFQGLCNSCTRECHQPNNRYFGRVSIYPLFGPYTNFKS